MKNLSKIACQCGCGARNVARGLLPAVAALEAVLGYEVSLRSMCRCEQRNRDEGGKEKSEHLATATHDCCALDISCPKEWGLRIQLVQAARKCGFLGIGYGPDFIHLDLGRPRFWFYPETLAQNPSLRPWKDPAA